MTGALARTGRLTWRAPPWPDIALAGAFVLWTQIELATGITQSRHGGMSAGVLTWLIPVAMSAPLAFRRQFPCTVSVIVFAAFAVDSLLLTSNTQTSTVAIMAVASYSVAAHARLLPAIVVGALGLLIGAASSAHPTLSLAGALFAAVIVGGSWAAGRAIRARRSEARALAMTVRVREEEGRAAVLEERARIARELHDIVAHSVSMMVVQADAAAEVLTTDPVAARTAIQSVSGSGRNALAELRRLLGVLRAAEEGSESGPQPGIARIAQLVEDVRAAGLSVQLKMDAVPSHLPQSMELTIYRVVQEALTNVMKHSASPSAFVSLVASAGAIVIEVIDAGPPAAKDIANAAGHGLVGMAERVDIFRGTIVSGPRPDGGFGIKVVLPLPQRDW